MTRKDRLVKWLRKKQPEALVVTVDGKDHPVAVAETRTKWSDTAELIESFAWQRLQGFNGDDQVILNLTPEDLADPDEQGAVEADEILDGPPDLNADDSYRDLGQLLEAQRFAAQIIKDTMREMITPIVGPITQSYADLVQVLQTSAAMAERQNQKYAEMLATLVTAAGGGPVAPDPNDGMMGRMLGGILAEYTKHNPDALGTLFGLAQGIFGGASPPGEQVGGQPTENPSSEYGGNNDPNKQAD